MVDNAKMCLNVQSYKVLGEAMYVKQCMWSSVCATMWCFVACFVSDALSYASELLRWFFKIWLCFLFHIKVKPVYLLPSKCALISNSQCNAFHCIWKCPSADVCQNLLIW